MNNEKIQNIITKNNILGMSYTVSVEYATLACRWMIFSGMLNNDVKSDGNIDIDANIESEKLIVFTQRVWNEERQIITDGIKNREPEICKLNPEELEQYLASAMIQRIAEDIELMAPSIENTLSIPRSQIEAQVACALPLFNQIMDDIVDKDGKMESINKSFQDNHCGWTLAKPDKNKGTVS